MNTDTMLRVLIAAPHESPMPEGLEQWTQISALTSIAFSAALIGAAVLILLKLRRQRRALLGKSATYTDSLGWRREADARAEWIRRTQWALGAAASNNDMRHFYGTTILEALARSDLTGPEDKSILDTVWAGSYTRMHDDEIRQLIAECRGALARDKLAANDRDEEQDPSATGENEAMQRSLAGNATRDDPAKTNEVFATLRREILAARLKVTLDNQLGRESSPTVKYLAGMKLPSIGRPQQSGGSPSRY
ncbi:hypothetical protein [Arthrobacter sp. Leaf69]|uniref:hypothetical protein n=1 Tax=Arthrobacter sp. Leaf69 TaxID=1736232 RepID=UPI0006FBE1E1|nr:hypothetical protein [Arthrobacter sp. Leaf69]KQN88983.1 hypothetical protein ASE96_04985 [Arthrobacter sp. Leaf69]